MRMTTPTSTGAPGSLRVSLGAPVTSQDMPFYSKKFIGAVKDDWQLFSDCADDYTIGAPIGFGASSIVYSATYHPRSDKSSNHTEHPIPCALKVLDLDSLPLRSLSLLQRETTLMSLSKHPNVLRVRGSWMDGHKLYIALRLMNKGSAADVMRYGWPGGMEEDVVRCILNQALQGLNYLHTNGFIHRDIKAANLLMDEDGTVLLGDLGVAANLADDDSNLSSTRSSQIHMVSAAALPTSQTQVKSSTPNSEAAKRATASDPPRPKIGKRKSFVGTPCWMAPELIRGQQYDSSADIWSFGITALELTQGRPPKSRETPQKVLLKIIQEAPPTLDREGGSYKYSRAFKDVIDSCLVKDPSKRPTAGELLQTPFFKSSKNKSYLVGAILKNLPPLIHRQERRVMNHTQSYRSIDSWDFATTVNLPTTNPYRRRTIADEAGPSVAVVTGLKATAPHSRSVLWGDESDISGNDEQGGAAPSSSHSDLSPGGSSPPSSIPESSLLAIPLSDSAPSSSMKASHPSHPLDFWSRIKTNAKRSSGGGGVAATDFKRAGTSPSFGSVRDHISTPPATQPLSMITSTSPTSQGLSKTKLFNQTSSINPVDVTSDRVPPTSLSGHPSFWNRIRRPSSPATRTPQHARLTGRKQQG